MRTVKNTIAVSVALATAAVSAEPALVPAPRHMKVGNGVYAVKADLEEDPFQYIGGHISLEKAYSFDPCEGVPDNAKSHVLGGQCNNWTEFTWNEHDLAWKMWPRTCAMAEALWTAPTPRDFADFLSRMKCHRRRLIAQGVNCAPLCN